ncbi:alpha-beta hydrolase superfamily lysophospholipase [Nonomuraea thailandensis]|uniref:Alpha-beta hydrolase superfamily lysophospholipase n=1 Tax=Nonomuraea thailandensis TaxID=1188745 RepID=A0A9X2G9Y9_9ACTN|nr:alpha/beta fold hydrolase [Nonomuraea thailandensis]MCP2353524.1 alpha-beta hydrolase superfamily lysophospholipase [Nonomuraea thailandensis]
MAQRPAPLCGILTPGNDEHIGRYEHVAALLVRCGAAVYGMGHVGHGESEGDRVLIGDFEDVVTGVHTVQEHARAHHPGVPVVVMIGHSMGGMIAARYVHRHGAVVAALRLSGP